MIFPEDMKDLRKRFREINTDRSGFIDVAALSGAVDTTAEATLQGVLQDARGLKNDDLMDKVEQLNEVVTKSTCLFVFSRSRSP
jgi:hypothetical protein